MTTNKGGEPTAFASVWLSTAGVECALGPKRPEASDHARFSINEFPIRPSRVIVRLFGGYLHYPQETWVTEQTRKAIADWVAIITSPALTVLTLALLYLAIWPRPSEQRETPSQAQPQVSQQHSSSQPQEQERRKLWRVSSPYLAASLIALAAVLNFFSARYQYLRFKVEKPKAIVTLSETSETPGNGPIRKSSLAGAITAGSAVRLYRPSSKTDRERNPRWRPEMDGYAGKEFIVKSCETNGFVRLEGLRFDVHISWLEAVPKADHARAT